jgi:hypothetical protein
MIRRENPVLYEVAREVSHFFGLPWTDPRTGKTSRPPVKKKKRRPRRKGTHRP